jgi:hypothetical protein
VPGRPPGGLDRHAEQQHFAICKAALEAGLHVVCERPLCFTVAEAEELQKLAADRNKIVGVTYGYAGHQMIEQARQMIARGDLGPQDTGQMLCVRGVEYWLRSAIQLCTVHATSR